MKFADSHCTYVEKYKPEHIYIFTGKCIVTGKEQSVTVKADELYRYRRGDLIQHALRSNSDDDREFLMSGISKEGWNKEFAERADNGP